MGRKKKMAEDACRQEARRRMHAALAAMDTAHRELSASCESLSSLSPLLEETERVEKLCRSISAEVRRLSLLQSGDRFTLDVDSSARFEAGLDADHRAWLIRNWGRGK